MVKRNSPSEKEKEFARETNHARDHTFEERFIKDMKKKIDKERRYQANKDKFARIIHVGNHVEGLNKNQTYVEVIVFTDAFAILKIKLFSSNEFILDEKINLGRKNRRCRSKTVDRVNVSALSPDSFQLLQNILVRRFPSETLSTKNEVREFLKSKSKSSKKSVTGTMPDKIRHRVYHDHKSQFSNG
jgi:hypothetical protein